MTKEKVCSSQRSKASIYFFCFLFTTVGILSTPLISLPLSRCLACFTIIVVVEYADAALNRVILSVVILGSFSSFSFSVLAQTTRNFVISARAETPKDCLNFHSVGILGAAP